MAVQKANYIWRDFKTDGVPSSGKNRPSKRLIRERETWVENAINAGLSNGGLVYDTKANMDADLAHDANTSAWVIGDSTVANNGIYQKQGVSGSGLWTRLQDLPYSFIRASNAGAGTANAIQATTSVPIPAADGAALITLNITANNTGAATVSFNGGVALTIKTATGADVQADYLVAGAVVSGFVVGSTFQLTSEVGTAAAAAAAQAAADAAVAAASTVVSTQSSKAYVSANYHPEVAPGFIQTAGDATAGDGGAALYRKVATEPSHDGKFSITLDDGSTIIWYEDTRKRIFIFASGQSNMAFELAYAWSPPVNLRVWSGSAFDAAPTDKIGVALAFAAEAARQNPDSIVYLFKVAVGGATIDKWIGGRLGWVFDNALDATGIHNGDIRLNNADASAATLAYVSIYDSDNNIKSQIGVMLTSGGTTSVRFEKADDPDVYAEYTVGTYTPVSNYSTVALTYIGGAGTLADGDALRIVTNMDIYAAIHAQLPSALAAAGVSAPTVHQWWQGENDSAGPATYVSEFETYWNRLVDDGFVDDATDLVVMGVNSQANSANVVLGDMALYLQQVVQQDPNRRTYVNTGSLPAALWTDALHMTAAGYAAAGPMAWNGYAGGAGFKVPPQGLVVHPETGEVVLTKDGTEAAPALTFLKDRTTGIRRAGFGDIRLVSLGSDWNEKVTWTPVLTAGTTAPTGLTAAAVGSGERIGGMFFFEVSINVSAMGTGGAGNLRVTGLPFSQISGLPCICACQFSQVNLQDGMTQLNGYIDTGKDYIDFMQSADNSANLFLQWSGLTDTSRIRLTGHMRIA